MARRRQREGIDLRKQADIETLQARVPIAREQAQFESGLAGERDAEKFGRESYISGSEMPKPLMSQMQMAPETKIRKEAMMPFMQAHKEAGKVSEYDKVLQRKQAQMKLEFPKAKGSYEKAIKSYDEILKLAKEIKDDPGLYQSTGLIGGRQEISPGARRIVSKLDTLESKTILGTMANLKELSKTGATGFGATNEREIDIMGRGVANIKNRKPGTEDYRKTVEDFIRQMEDSKRNVQNTFNDSYGSMIENELGFEEE